MVTRTGKRNLILTIILILFWSILFLFSFILKGSYVFEGQVTVNEMSFTYNGDSEKPLLQNIRGIKNLDIKGKQSQPLTLKGKFSSDDESINQQLSKLDRIKIEFPYATSRVILTSADPSLPNQLAITELRINPQTRINQLTYNQENELSFCLESTNQPSEYCLFPENAIDNSSKPEFLGKLKLHLAKEAYTLNLEQVNIPELNITSDINTYQALQFNYISQTQEPQLNILSPTQLFIDLPETKTNNANSTIETPRWFYEDIDVTNVDFYRFKYASNVTDEIPISTIIDGKIRMKDKTIELKNNQFLIISDDKPGIRKLRYLSINPLKNRGLQTFISGKSRGVAVGLYPQFPIEKIAPSRLSKYFSSEAIAAILSFISAFTAVALEKIFFSDNP